MEMNYLQDCPILAANNIANFQLYNTVKENGVKVLLNGQGADELFTGYPIYYSHYYLFAGKEERKELQNNIKNAPITWTQLKKDVVRLRFQRAFPSLFNKLKINKKPFNKYLARPIKTGVKVDNKLSKDLNSILSKDYYGQRLQEMLHWEDRNSMSFSIESRNPFADSRSLAGLALALPIKEKINLGWSKCFLRDNFKEYLPQEIGERRDKKGYSMPDIEWNRKWKKEILDCLSNDKLRPFIKTNKIIQDFDRLLSSNDIHLHKFLFRTMSLSHFLNLPDYINEMA
jgi:asparagine synthase (glutamine-hydrolysing)